MSKKISVVIPAYNEEGNIKECIERVRKLDPNYEIVVVDDGSKDRTYEIARKIGVKTIRYEKNMGKGYAVKVGFDNMTGDYGIILDADLACPPEDIPRIMRPLCNNEVDLVLGTRFIFPMEKNAMPGLHILGNKLFAFLASVMFRKKISDLLCGFKAISKKNYENLDMKESTWPDIEMIAKSIKNNYRIIEVPIRYKRRFAGKSKMKSISHGWKMLKQIIVYRP